MSAQRAGWLRLQFSWRFEILLVAVLVFLGISPFIRNGTIIGIFGTAVLISSIGAVNEGRVFTRIAWGLAILSLLALWAAEINVRVEFVIASGLFDIAFFLVVAGAILAYVFRATEVTRDTLAAAICAYLLMAIGWSNLFVVIENFAPGSFTTGVLATEVPGGLESVREQKGLFTYLSLVTLSTLGYGDITPVSQPARILAALEAIIGQLFIGVLIARLVGQQIKSKPDQ